MRPVTRHTTPTATCRERQRACPAALAQASTVTCTAVARTACYTHAGEDSPLLPATQHEALGCRRAFPNPHPHIIVTRQLFPFLKLDTYCT
eukprot:6183834-Pleurochrysis_carterae.AAC.2